MAQNHVLSDVSCCVGWSENLTCSSESPWNEDTKIGFGLISSSNTSREKQKNVFTKKAWIHWCVANCKLFYRTKNVLKIWSLKDVLRSSDLKKNGTWGRLFSCQCTHRINRQILPMRLFGGCALELQPP